MPSSLYTPAEARSLIETRPITQRVVRASFSHGAGGYSGGSAPVADSASQISRNSSRKCLRRAGEALARAARCGSACAAAAGRRPGCSRSELGRARRRRRAAARASARCACRCAVVARATGRRHALELRADRRRVDVAHQAADVLQLAAARLRGSRDALAPRAPRRAGRPAAASPRAARSFELDQCVRRASCSAVHVLLALRSCWAVVVVCIVSVRMSCGLRMIAAFPGRACASPPTCPAAPNPMRRNDRTLHLSARHAQRRSSPDVLRQARGAGRERLRGRRLRGLRPDRRPCAAARSRPSSTTATRASASPSTSASSAGYASTSDFSPKALARHRRGGALDRALHRRRRLRRARRTRDCWRARSATSTCSIPGTCRSSGRSSCARACEAAAFALDPRIVNSEGASVSTQQSQFVAGQFRRLRRGLSELAPLPLLRGDRRRGRRDAARRLVLVAGARCGATCATPRGDRRYAGRRALARLRAASSADDEGAGAVRGAGGERPARAASSPRSAAAACTARPRSCSTASGKQVFSPLVQMREEPHLPKRLASGCFDDDGVATHARDVVKDGVLQGYFLGTYSARKLGMKTHRQRRRQPQPDPQSRASRLRRPAEEDGHAACWSPT